MTFAHLRPGRYQRFKILQIGLGLTGQTNKGKYLNAIAKRVRVNIGMIAFDNAGIFQGANPPKAWRCRNTGIFGKIDIRHAPMILQIMQNLSINRVQFNFFSHKYSASIDKALRYDLHNRRATHHSTSDIA